MKNHHLSMEEAVRRLESDASNGLTQQEAVRRLSIHGENRLKETPYATMTKKRSNAVFHFRLQWLLYSGKIKKLIL